MELDGAVIDAYFDLADTIITVRSLIRPSWTLYRWDTRPKRTHDQIPFRSLLTTEMSLRRPEVSGQWAWVYTAGRQDDKSWVMEDSHAQICESRKV